MHSAIDSFFLKTSSSREEAALRAFPAHLVTPRLTSAEQLADGLRRDQRDRRSAQAPLLHHQIESSGSPGHQQHSVRCFFVDGTEQLFASHTN